VEKNLSVAADRQTVRDTLTAAGLKVDLAAGLISASGNLEPAKTVTQKQIKKMMDSKNSEQLEAFTGLVIDDNIKLAAAKESLHFTADKEHKKTVDSKNDNTFDHAKLFEHSMAQHEKTNAAESMSSFTKHQTQQDTAHHIDLLQL
jgi:hypothetical protein